MVDLKPGLVVYLGLVGPSVYIFLKLYEQGWSQLIPMATAAAGIYFFHEHFIAKSEVKVQKEQPLGPQEAYIPPEEWRYQLDSSGEFTPKKQYQTPTAAQREPRRYSKFQR